MRVLGCLIFAATAFAATVPFDSSAYTAAAVRMSYTVDEVTVLWPDEGGRTWSARFSLDPSKPLIAGVSQGATTVLNQANPIYRAGTGRRRGGWDQFFDFPESAPEGTRRFQGEFKLTRASATSDGNRLVLTFEGLRLGIFSGSIQYIFYPGGSLVQQRALVSTSEPDTAFYYEAGLRMDSPKDRRPGGNMDTNVSFYDTTGAIRTVASSGPERIPERVRYRSIASAPAAGAVAVFPPPHRFFFPRDFTTNLGYVWHSTWRGNVSIGIRQLPDDNWQYYPWFNSPPGTQQELDMFLLLSTGSAVDALGSVKGYTHGDTFPALPGYKTFAPHWHFAYTVQAMAKDPSWVPDFRTVLRDMGINIAMIMDFHGDGHPLDTGPVRLEELKAYFQHCREQSGKDFLLVPSEEIHQYFGGHWGVVFPKPVYWFMKREADQPFRSTEPGFGTVYRVGNAEDMLKLVHDENGFVYQAHPRTKGSTGFPDEIRESAQLRDAAYFGVGWKSMNVDLSSPRLGDRVFRTLDDLNNWGLHKRMMGEVDVFQIDSTHELYGHMNANYVRMDSVPVYDDYWKALEAIRRGDSFISTGEVLLRSGGLGVAGDRLTLRASVEHTFPLRRVEIVWGDGERVHTEGVALSATSQFATDLISVAASAKGWKWARFAVWDIAGNGAFVNPTWRDR